MTKIMSLNARKGFLASIKQKYNDANWIDKGKILDGIVAATGYERKLTCTLLLKSERHRITTTNRCDKLYF
jgi:hypothetical protein